MDLAGKWTVRLPDGREYPAELPGTLDENRIGGPDCPEKQWGGGTGAIRTRLTRRYTFTGEAVFARTVTLKEDPSGKRMVLTAERARKLRLRVNGEEAESLLPGTLSTPYLFETRALHKGENRLELVSDNSYPGWPADAILYSSAATDETQTNWNGVLGTLSLEAKPRAFLLGTRLRMSADGSTADLETDISVRTPAGGTAIAEVTVECGGFEPLRTVITARAGNGIQTLRAGSIPLRKDLKRWDPDEPNLYPVKTVLRYYPPEGEPEADRITETAGFRTFDTDGDMRLRLNGRRILLRGEANCAAWPETGHPPMAAAEWRDIIRRYRAYGVNCLRFHSHCPPEAAFEAADLEGMLMQPELSHWDPAHAFESDESFRYYGTELREILRRLARHPSFVMLSLGNELNCGETGEARMAELVNTAKRILPDRLYARGSNAFYGAKGCGAEDDFYTAQDYGGFQMRAISAAQDESRPAEKARIRGYLNNAYPSSRTNYRQGMDALREQCRKPMFSFEVGQYEVLPDFRETGAFRGVTDPENYRIIRRRAEEKGLLPIWDRMAEATGELALIGYREETEAVMRTPGMSGISLLGLQDFPGQGTALVGMMNAHLQPKPFDFARPERFEAFFRDSTPLILLDRYTWFTGETMKAEILNVHYGREDLQGTLELTLRAEDGKELRRTEKAGWTARAGEAETGGTFEIPLPEADMPRSAVLEARLREEPERFRTRVRIWIYPEREAVPPEGIHACRSLDAEAEQVLRAGGKVLLAPPSDKEHLPGAMRGQFSTDFWSVGTFPQQEGGMGLLIREDHPLFRRFPTSFHTDYPWWLMAGQCAMRLPDEKAAEGILVRQMDSCSRLDTFAMLLEAKAGAGRILISSMGLEDLPQKPEVIALRNAIVRYMQSAEFLPRAELSVPEIRSFCGSGSGGKV